MEYTSEQAAQYLGLSVRTIRYYVATQRLTPSRRVGRGFLFTLEELNRFKALPRKGGRPKKPRDNV